MESLAGNKLYAGDHNIDYVSTFQRKNKKKGKGEKEKKKRKSKEREKLERADCLLRCLYTPK
jgi:hypothetical protein